MSELNDLRGEKIAIEAALTAYLFSDVESPQWVEDQCADLARINARIKVLLREPMHP